MMRSRKLFYIFSRQFFFFFSDLVVEDSTGRRVGSVARRFGWITKKYDLLDENGRIFAKIRAPFWSIWKFPIINHEGTEVGEITKKWRAGRAGVLTELFTDADTFLVDFGQSSWTLNERLVIFASAISVDFDFFEDNAPGFGLFNT